jgi:hypothetical protein
MAIIGVLILIVITIVVVIFGFEYFSNFFEEIFAQLNNTAGNDSKEITFKGDDGDLICDLHFTLKGEFDQGDIPFAPLIMRLGESTNALGVVTQSHFPPVAEFQWKEPCYVADSSNQSPFSLSFFNKHNIGFDSIQTPKLALGSAGFPFAVGDTIPIKLKFTNEDGDSIDYTNDPKLQKTVKLPDGVFQIPFAYERVWILDDVKVQDYDVSIFTGKNTKINNLNLGVPYIYKITSFQ